MLKKITKMMLSLVMVLSLVLTGTTKVSAATPEQDMATIKTRLKEYFLELDTIDDGAKVETCTVSNAKTYLDMIQADGSFNDVDYDATNSAANGGAWSPYLALDRLQAIAIAYHKVGNDLYQKQEVVDKLNQAILHWGKEDPRATNWWENQVGVQLRFSRIALFMDGIISEDAKNIIMTKLLEKKPVKYGTGQNNLWFDQNYVYHALISEDETQLTDMIDNYLSYCLVIQEDDNTAEAVQVDNSFYMHGRQFYSNGYGMSMFRDMSFWIYMLRETQFALSDEVVDLMANYMIGGTSWTIRGDLLELYLGYRPYKYEVGYKNYAAEYIAPLQRMIAADPARANQYQSILDNIEDATASNGKNGNYYMWRSGYAGHMRNNYGVNIKMDSKNIIGGEWRGSWPTGQNGGQLIYWTSSAASTISVDGDEYINVYPTFDWAHCPGTTTASRVVQDYSNYGRFTNGTDHTIGLTNGKYGSTAYVMNKKDTQATKGYFFFDDEFVALGAGINSKEKVNIHTTLNQSEANQVTVGGTSVADGTKAKAYTTNWLHNDKIGYVFTKDTNVVVSNTKQTDKPSLWPEDKKNATPATFTAWIDHGLNPKDSSYEYIVVPGKTAAEVQAYANTIPVTVVSNTKDVQAVRHDGLKQTQINFYKAGSLEYKTGYTITVDQPCNVLIDESGVTRKITVAVKDTNANQKVNVEISNSAATTKTVFVSKSLPYAGQSMTLSEGADNRYEASSYKTGQFPQFVLDDNENTYWESETNGEQFISFFMGDSKYISNIDIIWGNNYGTEYEVYVSQNGKDYELISEVNNGNGSEESVNIHKLCSYVKIVMKNGNGATYQIKEIYANEGKLLSLNKPVEVSSVSTNAPTFTGNLAVDGDLGTRWASLRGKDDNWITIDLEKQAQVDAISIWWENACSDNYQIEVSDDNKNWTTVKSSLVTGANLNDTIEFDSAVSARYVKIHSLKSRVLDKNYGINIFEIKIYGNFDKEAAENIALNKETITSSVSTYDDKSKQMVGARAVDGVKTGDSRWAAARQVDDSWITIDLGVLSEIEEMSIYWEGACSDNYQIEISDDNKNWTTVRSSLKTDSSLKDTITFRNTLSARYVKVHSLKCRNIKYGVSIFEIEVMGRYLEEPPVNLVLGKPSKASSEYIDSKDGNKQYYSSLAFDGRTDIVDGKQSRWVSNRETTNEWIYVDLEDFYSIDKVVLNWEGAGAKEFKVQVSDDAQHWTDITHITDGKGGVTKFEYDGNQSGRYVRMYGVEPGSKYGFSLWEFEVYGKIAEDANVALSKPSKASSEYIDSKDGNKQYYSSLAFDGSADKINGKQSRWVSNRETKNEWIYVDLEDFYSVDKVVLNWEGAGAKEFKVQISDDAQHWTDITHITDGKGGVTKFEYDGSQSARYVRMYGVEPGSKYGFSLWEFEVYGRNIYLSKDPLQKLYDEYKAIDEDLYTPNSYKAFKEVLDETKVVLDDDNASNISIKEAETKLQKAHDLLVKMADKKALNDLIIYTMNIDKNQYTSQSLKEFTKALEAAKSVLNDKNATQKDVDNAAKVLKEAINNLMKKASKDDLINLVNQAEAIDRDIYTKDSLSKLDKAIEYAHKVIKEEHASQEDIDKAFKDVKDAYDNLTKKIDIDVDVDPGDQEQKPSKPDNNHQTDTSDEANSSNSAQTSDNSMIFESLMFAMLSVVGIFFTSKKYRKAKI